jgi:hypothetical protein
VFSAVAVCLVSDASWILIRVAIPTYFLDGGTMIDSASGLDDSGVANRKGDHQKASTQRDISEILPLLRLLPLPLRGGSIQIVTLAPIKSSIAKPELSPQIMSRPGE